MWNIALFVRAFVFHIAFVFRNILFKWNIGSRPISGMFRLFHVFRFSRGRGQIPRPGIFEARTPVSSKGVITLAQLLGLHAVRLEQAGQPPRVKRLAAERAPRGLFHHVQGFEQLARGESVTTLVIEDVPNVAEESYSERLRVLPFFPSEQPNSSPPRPFGILSAHFISDGEERLYDVLGAVVQLVR